MDSILRAREQLELTWAHKLEAAKLEYQEHPTPLAKTEYLRVLRIFTTVVEAGLTQELSNLTDTH